jgi:hypothetical protein
LAENTNTRGTLPLIVEMQDTITRLAGNTTQYTLGDAISDHATAATVAGYLQLDTRARAGGVRFLDFTMHKTDPDVTTADFALLLFTTLPALTTFEDNVAAGFTAAELRECKGVVPFVTANWVGGTAMTGGNIQTVSKELCIVLPAGSSTVYGILIAQSAYTPADGEVFTFTAHAIVE